mgnify:CR=1 FL=1
MIKKLLILFFLFFTLSCSGDKEIIEEPLDPIIGKWFFHSYNIGTKETLYDECKQKGYFQFTENGGGDHVTYWINRETNKCSLDQSKKTQWSIVDKQYNIKVFSQGSYGGILSFGITYQYSGTISEGVLKMPVGSNQTINFLKN